MALPGSPSQALPTEVINRMNAKLGTAYGGALDFPKPTAPPTLANGKVAGPDLFTVQIIVLHDTDITSIHVEGDGSRDPVGGKVAPGTIANQKFSFVVPRDFYGNIAFNNVGL